MAKEKQAKAKRSRFAWVGQVKQAYALLKENDPKGRLVALGVGFGTFLVLSLLGLLIFDGWIGRAFYIAFAIPIGFMAGIAVVGRRLQKVVYKQIDGQPGAALHIVRQMRGVWMTDDTPVAMNREMDVVHLVVGRPGIVLVGEGDPARVAALSAAEKRRVAKLMPDVPLYEVQIGNGDKQIPLPRADRYLTKLGRNIKPDEIRQIDAKLRAMRRPPVQAPKGPLPRSRGAVPRGRAFR